MSLKKYFYALLLFCAVGTELNAASRSFVPTVLTDSFRGGAALALSAVGPLVIAQIFKRASQWSNSSFRARSIEKSFILSLKAGGAVACGLGLGMFAWRIQSALLNGMSPKEQATGYIVSYCALGLSGMFSVYSLLNDGSSYVARA